MSESPFSASNGPSRRSLITTAAWAAPVILTSSVMPALAVSAIGAGSIAWTTPAQIFGAGYTTTISGTVTATSGALPTQVLIGYAGASITGDSIATVDSGTGAFAVTITAQSVEEQTTVTASATGFGSATVKFAVFVSSPDVLTFNKASGPGTLQPQWTSMPRATSGGVITDKWTLTSMLVGTDPTKYAVATGGFFLSSRFIGTSVIAGSGMTIRVLGSNNASSHLFWSSGTYGYGGPQGQSITGGRLSYRMEVGMNGTVPTTDGSPGIAPGDTTNYATMLRTANDTIGGGGTTTISLQLEFDTLPNYRVQIYVNYV